MGSRAFFDTNVLVYIHDKTAPMKRTVAAKLAEQHFGDGTGVLSTQVLQEFYITLRRKVPELPAQVVRALVLDYARLNVVGIKTEHVVAGIDTADRFKLSFWDGLILTSAKAAGASTLYSEDFSHGRVYDGVLARNPFRETNGAGGQRR